MANNYGWMNSTMQQWMDKNPNSSIAQWNMQMLGSVPMFTGNNSGGNNSGGGGWNVNTTLGSDVVGAGDTSNVGGGITPGPFSGSGNNDPDAPWYQMQVTQQQPRDMRGFMGPRGPMNQLPGWSGGYINRGSNMGTIGSSNFGSPFQSSMMSNPFPDIPTNHDGVTSFAEGGMMGPGGVAIRPGSGMQPEVPLGAAAPAPLTPQQIEQEAQRLTQMHPQAVQQVQAMLSRAIQSGELNPNELNMAIQLAKTALGNPAAYPQIRQFAIQNGLGTEQDIPQELDQGLLLSLLIAGKAMQTTPPQGGNAMQGQAPAKLPSYAAGGLVPDYKEGGKTYTGQGANGGHLALVHEDEIVFPKKAVMFYGTDKLMKMIEKVNNPDGGDAAQA